MKFPSLLLVKRKGSHRNRSKTVLKPPLPSACWLKDVKKKKPPPSPFRPTRKQKVHAAYNDLERPAKRSALGVKMPHAFIPNLVRSAPTNTQEEKEHHEKRGGEAPPTTCANKTLAHQIATGPAEANNMGGHLLLITTTQKAREKKLASKDNAFRLEKIESWGVKRRTARHRCFSKKLIRVDVYGQGY